VVVEDNAEQDRTDSIVSFTAQDSSECCAHCCANSMETAEYIHWNFNKNASDNCRCMDPTKDAWIHYFHLVPDSNAMCGLCKQAEHTNAVAASAFAAVGAEVGGIADYVDFTEGFITGLLGQTSADVYQCTLNMTDGLPNVVLYVMVLADDVKSKVGFDQFTNDLKTAIDALVTAAELCAPIQEDVVAQIRILRDCCHSPGDIVKQIRKNVAADKEDVIFFELEAAFRTYTSWTKGQHFGNMMNRALFGQSDAIV